MEQLSGELIGLAAHEAQGLTTSSGGLCMSRCPHLRGFGKFNIEGTVRELDTVRKGVSRPGLTVVLIDDLHLHYILKFGVSRGMMNVGGSLMDRFHGTCRTGRCNEVNTPWQ